ncbi:MAG: PaeR7I family type II restriction endonuclease [Phycisphaerae bacterium]|nr:PaeR7I family type II restriction endonuclease [Phycisphaerae bacterium]
MKAELRAQVSEAVGHFWRTRNEQETNQGAKTGQRDHGARSAVTGGKQLDGFIQLIRNIVVQAGLPEAAIHRREASLPGYFRPTKEWDLLLVADGNLIATLEFKSQVGPSFGNNFNNRTEEALGSATDLWTAHREGAFKDSLRPWLGYFILVEDTKRSQSPVSVREPHFRVFPEFQNASYVKRYELFCQRLVREGLYNAACLLTSPADGGARGEFAEPCAEIGVAPFVASLAGHVTAYSKLREQRQ